MFMSNCRSFSNLLDSVECLAVSTYLTHQPTCLPIFFGMTTPFQVGMSNG